jgi:allophanate hydrolase
VEPFVLPGARGGAEGDADIHLTTPADLSIATLAPLLDAGELKPADLLEEVLARADAYPDPAVWIHRLSRDRVSEQVEAIERRRRGGVRQPLYGIPFAVKDNIDVAGEPTTAACPAFAYVPGRSATVVTKLIDAGAVLVGKTNLDQFATGLVGTRSPYGACRNVFDRRYISGGSSSGSAVAVAAGLVSFALGTDTAGSGRVPAAFNNLVGLKPTRGIVSAAGVVPACRTLDCVSVFTRTCDDAGDVLDLIEGFDPADPYARPADDPARRSRPPANRPIRFGVPPAGQLEFFGNTGGESLYWRSAERLAETGAERVEVDFTPFDRAARLLYDGPWVAERVAAIRPFFERQPDALLPVTRRILESSRGWDAVRTFEAMYQLQSLRRAAAEQWERMDVMLLPTAGTIYTVEEVDADPVRLNSNLGRYTNFVNLLDLAAVAVPAGFQSGGLPFGVTLMAPAGSDRELLELGQTFQRNVS